MRRLALAIMVVSAFSLADVTFGFQETEEPKDKKARAEKTRKADRESMPAVVSARGSLECASVCDIRCEASSTDAGGVLIREIVPEGTLVKKGQVLLEFDTSGLEEQVVRQQMACNASEAGVITSQSEYDVTLIERECYVEGTFKLAKLEAELAVFVLKEAHRRAEQELEIIENSAEEGQTPKRRLEAAAFAVAKAQKEVELGETRLLVLQKYTHVKTLKQLDAKIKTAKARLLAEQHGHDLSLERLEQMGSQIKKCVIKTPVAGRVVYAKSMRPRSPAHPAIAEGARLRQGQPILSIRDPGKMQIKVAIAGDIPAAVKLGTTATIAIDAFPDMELKGTIEKITGARSARTSTPTYDPMKVCEITVGIQDPPQGLRAGMTGEVRIQAGGDNR